MKNNFILHFIGIISLITFILLGLGSATGGGGSQPALTSLPPWINDVAPEGAIWGIGVSGTAGNMNVKMQQAQARGRVAIAQQLDTKVQAMVTDYFMAAGGATLEFTESISRQVTQMQLQGVTQAKSWTAKDGSFWVLMQMGSADARNGLASIMGNQEAQFAEFKASQALAMLDAQLNQPSAAQVRRD